jgi:hypothetical protein
MSLAIWIAETLGTPSSELHKRLADPRIRSSIEKQLAHTRVFTLYKNRKGDLKEFKFEKLSCGGAHILPAYGKYGGTTVKEHYEIMHNIILRNPLLQCACHKYKNNVYYYPLELLNIVPHPSPYIAPNAFRTFKLYQSRHFQSNAPYKRYKRMVNDGHISDNYVFQPSDFFKRVAPSTPTKPGIPPKWNSILLAPRKKRSSSLAARIRPRALSPTLKHGIRLMFIQGDNLYYSPSLNTDNLFPDPDDPTTHLKREPLCVEDLGDKLGKVSIKGKEAANNDTKRQMKIVSSLEYVFPAEASKHWLLEETDDEDDDELKRIFNDDDNDKAQQMPSWESPASPDEVWAPLDYDMHSI